MNKYFLVLILILGVSSVSFSQTTKAIYVIADGIPADVIEKLNTPNIDKIAAIGGYTRAHVGGEKGTYSETPTISAVGYNSLLTGTWVNKHNVFGNSIRHPNYNYWTIFRFFKDQYPQKRAAIFSTWEDNRTKLIGEGLPQTGSLKLDYHFDGLELDTVKYPHDNNSNYIHLIDEAVVNNAVDHIRNESPDLSWVYLQYTDDMGHRFGDSPEFYHAVKIMDNQIGKLWDAINYREKTFNERWIIYITTDHGRDPETGRGHGGQSDRERTTWIVTNDTDINGYFKSGGAGIVDIMPTLARILKINIPEHQQFEIDGVPLRGKISLSSLSARKVGDELLLKWRDWDKKRKAKIFLSTTNNFKTGGTDHYQLMKKVKVKAGEASLKVKNLPSNFYKIVVDGPYNSANTWVVE